jgi:hypothetical protein
VIEATKTTRPHPGPAPICVGVSRARRGRRRCSRTCRGDSSVRVQSSTELNATLCIDPSSKRECFEALEELEIACNCARLRCHL